MGGEVGEEALVREGGGAGGGTGDEGSERGSGLRSVEGWRWEFVGGEEDGWIGYFRE